MTLPCEVCLARLIRNSAKGGKTVRYPKPAEEEECRTLHAMGAIWPQGYGEYVPMVCSDKRNAWVSD